MNVLAPTNKPYSMNNVADTIEEDLRYAVLDYSNINDVDFYFIPLCFLEVFSRPAAALKIGPYKLNLPLDWSIIIADKNQGLVEVIALQQLNDREFDALILNPLNSYIPQFYDLQIENIYSDITWSVPRLKFGHLLAVPLTDEFSPPCVFIAKDTNRIPESLDISKIFI